MIIVSGLPRLRQRNVELTGVKKEGGAFKSRSAASFEFLGEFRKIEGQEEANGRVARARIAISV